MNIIFTHKRKKNEIPIPGACEVKYYAVPTEYSTDGYFAAVWTTQELEPVPACSGEAAELLAHVRLMQDNNGDTLQECFCAQGVKYAKN